MILVVTCDLGMDYHLRAVLEVSITQAQTIKRHVKTLVAEIRGHHEDANVADNERRAADVVTALALEKKTEKDLEKYLAELEAEWGVVYEEINV